MENRTCGEQCAILLENIAWLRKYYGISKTRMVKLLGIGLHSLNKMEKGEMPPKLKLDVLIRIHRLFGIHPRDQVGKRLGEVSALPK